MILNSKNSNFVLLLPKNFIYPDIVEKYERFLSRMPRAYETVIDYLNQAAQSMSFPAISADVVEQQFENRKQQWKGGHDFDWQLDRNFSITFKLNEGFINYWIFYEQFRKYLAYKQTQEFLPDIRMSFIDRNGYELVTFEFLQITMTGVGDLTLDFSSNTPDFNTFTVDFTFNDFMIKHRIN